MPVQALDPFKKNQRRPQNPNSLRSHRIQKRTNLACERRGPAGITIGHHDSGKRRERRVEHCFPVSRLTGVKILEALVYGELKCVMVRKVALNDDFPRPIAAAGAARHLGEQLKCSFRGAKIRQLKRRVGSDDSYQRDSREIVSLRYHLGPDQNVDFTASETAENSFVVAHMPHGVAVHTADACVGKSLFEIRFQTLRSFAHIVDVLAVTFGTPRWWTACKTAVVAQKFADRAMVRHRNAAGTALECKTAMTAQQKRGITAPVEQN